MHTKYTGGFASLIIFIGIVIVLTGGIYVIKDAKVKDQNTIVSMEEVRVSEKIPASQTTNNNIITQLPTTTVNAGMVIKNCGTLSDLSRFTADWGERTAADKTSLSCMDEALTSCSKARLNYVAQEGSDGYIEISGISGNNCSILHHINDRKYAPSLICSTPLRFISLVRQLLMDTPVDPGIFFQQIFLNQIDSAARTSATASGSVTVPYPPTGESFTITCSQV